MKIIILSLLLLLLVSPQENLYPISKCLGDCVICSLNEPSLCSGKEFVQCAKGYDGPGCALKPSFANEIVLMDKNKQRGNAANWILNDAIKCHYINSLKQNISVYILGIYSQFKYNEVTVTVEPFYQNFVSSFNLIRGSWTPFSDLLRVSVSDQEDNIILEYFIDFQRRDEITAEKDPLICNNEHLISQKYEVQGAINPKQHKTLTFKFEGMMFSEAIWGLTNVKIAFGCSNFLLFNGAMCQNCQTGYYPIKDIQENVIGCQPCQLSCSICSSNKICQKCVDGFSLSDGKCVSKMISRIFTPQQKSLICSNKSYKISNSSGKQQKISLDIKSIPLHKKLNLIFNIAYAPKKTQKNIELSVFVDGNKQIQISSLLQTKERKPKAICEGFGADKYYQLHKVVISSINHKMENVKIQIVGKGGMKFGVQSVLYQYQQDIQQKAKENEKAQKIDQQGQKPGEADGQKQNKDMVKDDSDKPQQENRKQQVEQKEQENKNKQEGQEQQTEEQKDQQQEKLEQSEKPKQQNIETPNQKSIQSANEDSKNKQGEQNIMNENKNEGQSGSTKQIDENQKGKEITEGKDKKDVGQQEDVRQKDVGQEEGKLNKDDLKQSGNEQKQKDVKQSDGDQKQNNPDLNHSQKQNQENQSSGKGQQITQKTKKSEQNNSQKPDDAEQQQQAEKPKEIDSNNGSNSGNHQKAAKTDEITKEATPSRVPKDQQKNSVNIGQSNKQSLQQNPIQNKVNPNDDSKNKAEVSNKQQQEISRKQKHAQNQKSAQQQTGHTQKQAQTGQPIENLEQQKKQEDTQNKQRESEKQLSVIAESISKLKKNKWSIEVGLKLGRELIISLYYPMTLQHFPYFSAVLTNNNFTIIPQVIDVSKHQQQLLFDIHRSLLNQNIEIYMLEKPPLRRRLQESQSAHLLGTVHVRRFDHLTQQQWNSVNNFSSFFQVLSWITIILTIIFTFLGNSVVTQSFSLLLQIIFLHTYIFSEYLPINFKFVIGGLYRMQNLNYFHKELAEKIQNWLMGNVIQFSPMKFTNYSKDVNFSRAIYPCLIINGLYLLWFLINNLIKYKLQPYHDNDDQKNGKPKIKLFFIQIAQRVMNFWYQVWQYQYIVFMWAGFTQLHNLVYPQGANRSAAPNLILCGICLLMGLILPICTFFYIRSRYFRIDYFEYNYWYQNIFYLQLPPCSIPTGHHRFNILARNVRYIALILCFSFLGDYPIQALSLLIFNHIIYTLYLKMTKIEIKKINLIFSVLENLFLILLAVGIIAAFGLSDVLSTTNYMAIGYILITLVLLTTAVGLAKTGYLCFKKFNDTIGKKERSSISQDEARE